MLRRSFRYFGNFVISHDFHVDWRIPILREDRHAMSKQQLQKIVATSAAAPPSIRFMNSLLREFVANCDIENASATLKYIREQMQYPLEPFHYNMLLRCFIHSMDRQNTVQLLQVMKSREEMDLKTAAVIVDALHSFGVQDRLSKILQVMITLQEQKIPLGTPYVDDCKSEGDPPEVNGVDPRPYHAPVLTSTLHAVSVLRDSAFAAMLIAFWIRAVGAELSIWDYNHLLTALTKDPNQFLDMKMVFAAPDTGLQVGYASLSSIKRRIKRLVSGGARNMGNFVNCTQMAVSGAIGYAEVPTPETCLKKIIPAMETSWAAMNLSPDEPIYVGFLNSRWSTLDALIANVLTEAGRRPSGCGVERGSLLQLYHAQVIVRSQMRTKAQAMAFFKSALMSVSQQRAQHLLPTDSSTDSYQSAPPKGEEGLPQRRQKAVDTEHDQAKKFQIDHLFLKDASNFFCDIPSGARFSLKPYFETFMDLLKQHSNSQEVTDTDLTVLWSMGIPLRQTAEDRKAALKDFAEALKARRGLNHRTLRSALKNLLILAADTVPKNLKLSVEAYEERLKWWKYREARDLALMLFGHSEKAQRAMKEFYELGGRPVPLRSENTVNTDLKDFSELFGIGNDVVESHFKAAVPKKRRTRPFLFDSQGSATNKAAASSLQTSAMMVGGSHHQSCSTTFANSNRTVVVPEHLYDPNVYNPYPHIRIGVAKPNTLRGTVEEPVEDIFPAILDTLRGAADDWWLADPEIWSLVLRAYLHRLQWIEAVQLCERALKLQQFTGLLDQKLAKTFWDIGDPLGAQCFKFAAQLIPGKIVATKRHQRN